MSQTQSILNQAYEFIRSYRTRRKQGVNIGKPRNEWRVLERGLPQGSVAGPLLYLIMNVAAKFQAIMFITTNKLPSLLSVLIIHFKTHPELGYYRLSM